MAFAEKLEARTQIETHQKMMLRQSQELGETKQLLEEVRLENIKLSKSIGNLESSMLSTMNERQSQVAKNVIDMSIIREPKLEKPV